MLVFRVIWLGILLLIIPTIVGTLLINVDRKQQNLPSLWMSGQMLLWAGFHIIAVPFVLTEGRFQTVVILFSVYTAMCLFMAISLLAMKKKKVEVFSPEESNPGKCERKTRILWVLFWVLLAVQLVASVFLAYADGDDAFYVATAAVAEESDTMYYIMPYTGGTTGLDARYGLAPFPLWIAYLARITGIRTVTVAQVLVPPVLIAMAYGVYYLLANRFFVKKKECIPLFLIFTQLLVLFGDYSMYTPEKFLIARSRQGKAALSAIVIPFLIYVLWILLEALEEKKKVTIAYWCLLISALTTACLCSTLGAVLSCLLMGITGICGAFCYRKWKILIPMAVCCVPCVVEALLYLMY